MQRDYLCEQQQRMDRTKVSTLINDAIVLGHFTQTAQSQTDSSIKMLKMITETHPHKWKIHTCISIEGKCGQKQTIL